MTHDLTRNYDSDFSATDVKDTLNSVARENGSSFKTPVADAEPSRPEKNEFEVETRAGVDHLGEELGASQGTHYEADWWVLGTVPAEDKAIVRVAKAD